MPIDTRALRQLSDSDLRERYEENKEQLNYLPAEDRREVEMDLRLMLGEIWHRRSRQRHVCSPECDCW